MQHTRQAAILAAELRALRAVKPHCAIKVSLCDQLVRVSVDQGKVPGASKQD